jgi:biotin carboxyl carrier protein
MKLRRRGSNEELEIEIERVDQTVVQARVGTKVLALELTRLADGALLLSGSGWRHQVFAQQIGDAIFVAVGSHSFVFAADEAGKVRPRAAYALKPEVTAPMPGRVVKILVEQGTVVQRGQPLVVLEAMKMETVLSAEFAATVASVRVAVGAQVEAGSVLLELSPLSAPLKAESAAS